MCFPPSADRLALGSADGSVRVWSLEGEPGELWQVADAHGRTVLALAFSKCGRRLASGGDDGNRLYLIRLEGPYSGAGHSRGDTDRV